MLDLVPLPPPKLSSPWGSSGRFSSVRGRWSHGPHLTVWEKSYLIPPPPPPRLPLLFSVYRVHFPGYLLIRIFNSSHLTCTLPWILVFAPSLPLHPASRRRAERRAREASLSGSPWTWAFGGMKEELTGRQILWCQAGVYLPRPLPAPLSSFLIVIPCWARNLQNSGESSWGWVGSEVSGLRREGIGSRSWHSTGPKLFSLEHIC